MKNVAIALTAVAGLAAGAHGQAFEVVITTPANGPDITPGVPDYLPGTTIEYSIYMDNGLGSGGGFTNFFGWASFAGRTDGPGTHNLPDELSGTQNTTSDIWEGRRPPATFGFPGGAAGGFRFAAQTYTAIPNGLEGAGGLAYEGLAASTPLGGFQQDGSPRLEVFRGSFVGDVEGVFDLDFNPVDAAYFADAGFNTTVIGASNDMDSLSAAYAVGIPAPASLALLGLGGLAARRRR